MSKFQITLKQDELVPRKELKETLTAFLKHIDKPDMTHLLFNLQSKPKRGKVTVNVIEFPLAPIREKRK